LGQEWSGYAGTLTDDLERIETDNDLALKAAALKLGLDTETEFDRIVDSARMVKPYVATATAA